MHVVVGLHNPGPDLAGTRHNVGAEVATSLSERWGQPFKRGPLRVRAAVTQARSGNVPVTLALPRSAMNGSGGPVSALLRYFKVAPGDLLVIHDDIDLPFARLRLHLGRGSGGHNGVSSVVQSLGTKEFWRLKLGVGRPPGSMDPADFVLRAFSRKEADEIELLVQDAADVVEEWLADPRAATRMASERKPPP